MTTSDLTIAAIGLLSQGFFSARTLVQWYKSEKEGKLTSPSTYWVFSLAGSWLMFIYGWCRKDFSILLGQFISYYVYIGNLYEKGLWGKMGIVLKAILASTPAIATCFVLKDASGFAHDFLMEDSIPLWLLLLGTFGQVIFTLRFVYQIVYTARRHVSALPLMFWIISITGSTIIIAYALLRKDIVLLLGQSFGFVVYLRNIMIGARCQGRKES